MAMRDPNQRGAAATAATTPPVGLNWKGIADAFGWDQRVLEREGIIVVTGEYFPDEGYFIDPATMQVHRVDVGELALRTGYFLGRITVSNFGVNVVPVPEAAPTGHPVIRSADGPIVGLFAAESDATRAKRKLLQNSLGSGIGLTRGPLGYELRIDRPELAGRVATLITQFGGAVIAVGGRPISAEAGTGPSTTALPDEEGGDTVRGGTGATSDTQGPRAPIGQTEVVDGEEIVP